MARGGDEVAYSAFTVEDGRSASWLLHRKLRGYILPIHDNIQKMTKPACSNLQQDVRRLVNCRANLDSLSVKWYMEVELKKRVCHWGEVSSNPR